jgi:hypothetical protein
MRCDSLDVSLSEDGEAGDGSPGAEASAQFGSG